MIFFGAFLLERAVPHLLWNDAATVGQAPVQQDIGGGHEEAADLYGAATIHGAFVVLKRWRFVWPGQQPLKNAMAGDIKIQLANWKSQMN